MVIGININAHTPFMETQTLLFHTDLPPSLSGSQVTTAHEAMVKGFGPYGGGPGRSRGAKEEHAHDRDKYDRNEQVYFAEDKAS